MTSLGFGLVYDLLGSLLAQIGKGGFSGVDVALSIAEGYGGRTRETWAPVLLEMAGVPALGSDALTLAATLDSTCAGGRATT